MLKTNQLNEQRLKQRKERFRLLVEAVEAIRDYAIFMLDPDGYILTWNAGAERIKGYTEDEIVGKHMTIFYTQEDLDRKHPQAELKEAKKVGRYEDEGWRVRKDGTRFWANVIITKLTDKDGRLMGFSKVTRDLTEKRAAEQRLRESEERFRLLVSSVKDYAIYMLDPDGRISSWNEGAERIKGYQAREVLGKHFSLFYLDEDIAAGKPEYELKEAKLTGRYEEEGWRIRKDGSLLWASVVLTAIRDRNRRLLGYTKVTRDLTEKKRAEDRLQRAYAGLEKTIQERTAALASANDQLKASQADLQEAVRVRDEFLSIASHELKTPITSLRIQLQMLRRKTDSSLGTAPPPAKLESSLDSSLRQVDRLTALVEDLLDVARSHARKLSFHFEQVELGQLAADVVGRLADQAQAAGCAIRLDAPEEIRGSFDRFRLDQVLVNLLTNALKYAPGKPVEVSLRRSGAVARLAVRDQGPGIPLERQESIFERFERATSSRSISGLGLGLYITREIVAGHRGSIRVESEPGSGATFVVELPLNLVPVRPGQQPERAGPPKATEEKE